MLWIRKISVSCALPLLAGVLISASGCGGDDDDGGGNVQALCNDAADAICERVYECLTDAQREFLGFPDSIAACKSEQRDELGCDTATEEDACEGSETYHSDAAERCVDQLESASCSQIEGGEDYSPACDEVCTVE